MALAINRPTSIALLLAFPFFTYLVLRLLAVSWVRASMSRAVRRIHSPTALPDTGEVLPPDRPLRFEESDESLDLED